MANLIYKIENQVNGKVYIGQTTQSLRQRKAEHLVRLRANKRQHKIYLALRKYGEESFTFSEYANVLSEIDLDRVEIDIIKQFNSFNRGYNSTAGGDTLSQATKDKIAQKMMGRKITWSDKITATKRKNDSFAQKGHGGYGKDHRAAKSYEVKAPSGDIIRFKGLRQFCRDNNLSHNLLLTTLTGIQSHHKGYVLLKTFND